jgi:hypothetical protein
MKEERERKKKKDHAVLMTAQDRKRCRHYITVSTLKQASSKSLQKKERCSSVLWSILFLKFYFFLKKIN